MERRKWHAKQSRDGTFDAIAEFRSGNTSKTTSDPCTHQIDIIQLCTGNGRGIEWKGATEKHKKSNESLVRSQRARTGQADLT